MMCVYCSFFYFGSPGKLQPQRGVNEIGCFFCAFFCEDCLGLCLHATDLLLLRWSLISL